MVRPARGRGGTAPTFPGRGVHSAFVDSGRGNRSVNPTRRLTRGALSPRFMRIPNTRMHMNPPDMPAAAAHASPPVFGGNAQQSGRRIAYSGRFRPGAMRRQLNQPVRYPHLSPGGTAGSPDLRISTTGLSVISPTEAGVRPPLPNPERVVSAKPLVEQEKGILDSASVDAGDKHRQPIVFNSSHISPVRPVRQLHISTATQSSISATVNKRESTDRDAATSTPPSDDFAEALPNELSLQTTASTAPTAFVTPQPLKRKITDKLTKEHVRNEISSPGMAPVPENADSSAAKVKRARAVLGDFQKTISVKRLNKVLRESFRSARPAARTVTSDVGNMVATTSDAAEVSAEPNSMREKAQTEIKSTEYLKRTVERKRVLADDESKYIDRLQTFAPVELWWCKPDQLSPVECARRGWRLIGMDQIECVSCLRRLQVDLVQYYENATGSASRRAAEQVFIRRMRTDGHAPLCQWRTFVCPLYLSNVFVHNNTWKSMSQLFRKNMSTWLNVSEDDMPVCSLPERLLQREFSGSFDAVFDAVKQIVLYNFPDLKFSAMPTAAQKSQQTNINQHDWRLFSAALLSIFGFHSETNEFGWPMFKCRSCLHRDFTFTCKTVERMLINTTLSRDSIDGLTPSEVYKAVTEQNVGENFLLFQLIGNHRAFCPWRQDQLAYASFLPQRFLQNVPLKSSSLPSPGKLSLQEVLPAGGNSAELLSQPLSSDLSMQQQASSAAAAIFGGENTSLSSGSDDAYDSDDIRLPGYMLCFKLLCNDAEASSSSTKPGKHGAIESARKLLEFAKAAKRGIIKMVDDLPLQHRNPITRTASSVERKN